MLHKEMPLHWNKQKNFVVAQNVHSMPYEILYVT